jgi:hypothetical protein
MGFLTRKRKLSTRRIPRRNNLYYRYENLSEMWREYAELLSNTDLVGKEKEVADAWGQSAMYKRNAIFIDEKLLLEEERQLKNSDDSDNP